MHAEPMPRSGAARQIARAAGGLAILVGGGHVLAWVSGAMPQVPVSTIIMKANAGLALLMAGAALILLGAPQPGARQRRVAQSCAAFVLLLGLATLSEHIVGWNLGIDQLLATEPVGAAATTSPNRMGLPASLSCILIGTALLLLARRAGTGRRRALHEPFALVVALLGLLSIIGYLYGVSALYQVARLTGVAWPTALSFVVLAIGVLCVEPANGLMRRITADDPGGAIVRALLGPMVVVPLALGWVRLAGERRGWFDAPMGTGLMMLVFIVIFSSLLLFASRRVSAASSAQLESEREARSQKDLLAVTLASIGDAVIVTDTVGAVTFRNAEAARLTGWTDADARGRPLPDVFSIVDEETRERVENPVERVLRLGQVIGLGNHTLLVARDGRRIPIDDSGAPIRQAGGGEVRGVVLVFRDVSGRRQAEQVQRRLLADVQAQKDRLAALVNSMTDEIWFADADKRLTLVNPAVWKEFGTGVGGERDVEEIAASFEVYRPDGTPRPVDEAPPLRALRGETVTDQEEIVRTPATGQLRHRQVSAAPVRDADGAIVGSVSVVRDVTARKQAEQEARQSQTAVRASEERLRFALEACQIGAWDIDLDDHTADRSLQHDRVFGYQELRPSWTLDDFLRHVLPEYRAEVETMVREATAAGTGWTHECPIRRADGEVRWIWFSGDHRVDGSGRRRVAGVVQDITKRKKAEEALRDSEQQLRRLNDQLIDADRRKNEFIAILSHELRNPLAPIRYALPLLAEERLGAAGRRATAVIDRQVTHLARLVDDLLDVSRITTGKVELLTDDVALDAVLSAAVEAASPAIAAAQHSLDVAVPDGPIWLRADPARIAQAVTNLLNNSAKYTPKGGRIRLEATASESDVVVRVVDNGSGITPDALPTIFEMFHQVSGPNRSQGGLGIGLTLAKQFVEMHGGTIEARSAGEGQGAEFVIRLPLAPARHRPPDAPATTACGQTGCLRVLVVDDNVDLVEMLAVLIEASGHQVRKAFDGRSAISAALEYQPHVVFLDLGMPDMGGVDVAKELRRRPQTAGTRIVALTGWGQAEDRRRTADAGFDEHVTKPADPERLRRLLERFAAEASR